MNDYRKKPKQQPVKEKISPEEQAGILARDERYMRHALELAKKAAELGAGALCFEGNIDFYGKSGFDYASRFSIRYHGLPEGEDASFFLCRELIPGYLNSITGEYATPQGYFVDEAEAEEFDKQFPPKEKLRLPGQIF